MNLDKLGTERLQEAADAALEEAASRLHDLLSQLAARLHPFPSFWNMASVQAIELQPTQPAGDRGCVVVCPDGQICELNLQFAPGIAGLTEVEQMEEFLPLTLPPLEYIIYASTAIEALAEELRRRGKD